MIENSNVLLRERNRCIAIGRRATRQSLSRDSNYKRDRKGAWFVLPFFAVFALFLIGPLAYAVFESLHTTTLIGGTHFSGLSNYRAIIQDAPFWGALLRVVVFGVVEIPIMLGLAFFFATMFDLGIAKFGRVLRTVFFVPFAVPSVVGAVMWAFLLDPANGAYTRMAQLIGFTHVDFFSSNLILPSIIGIAVWQYTGYNMMILYTALKSVPTEYVEAAVLDGASLSRVILQIKLPSVRPAIVLLMFLSTIGALQLFTEPMILSYFQNQAVTTSFTPTIYIYNTAIGGGQYGLSAAGAVLLGLLVVILSVASLAARGRRGRG